MSPGNRFFPWIVLVSLVLATGVFFAGCSSPATSQSGQPALISPATTSGAGMVPGPATKAPAPASFSTAGNTVPAATAYLSHGVTLAYPSDWQVENGSGTSLQDYGQVTTNIANFFSPDISPERALKAQPNVDSAENSALIIDVDPVKTSDFEEYFNLATLALQKKYGSIKITKHNYQLKMSVTDSFSGYKAYQLDFDTKTMRRTYIFTNVVGTVYVFTVSNPSPYSVEIGEMIDSVRIEP